MSVIGEEVKNTKTQKVNSFLQKHNFTNIHSQIYMQAHTHVHIHAHTKSCTEYTHAHIHAYTEKHCTHTHIHTHMCPYMRTNMCTHIHKQGQNQLKF